MGPYNVTKAAVVALSETLAGELAGTGVGVSVLCPFFFTTNIAKSSRSSSTEVSPEAIEGIMKKTTVQAERGGPARAAPRATAAASTSSRTGRPRPSPPSSGCFPRRCCEDWGPWRRSARERDRRHRPATQVTTPAKASEATTTAASLPL